MTILAVLIGGGIGAVCRYATVGVVARRQHSPFPLGTLLVNVIGSTLLGALFGAFDAGVVPDGVRPWIIPGFFGGLTTFSTFTYENLRLVEEGAWRYAAWNVVLTGPLSFAGAAGGYLGASGAL